MFPSVFRPSTVLLYTQEGGGDQQQQQQAADEDDILQEERQKLVHLAHFLREMDITVEEYDTMVELLEDRQEEMLQRVCAIEELLETLSEVENGSANMERDHASYFAAKFQDVWDEEDMDGDSEGHDDEEDGAFTNENLDEGMHDTNESFISVYPSDISQLYGQMPATAPASMMATSTRTMRSGPPRPSGSFMYKLHKLQNASPQESPQNLRKMVQSFAQRLKQAQAPPNPPHPPKQPPNIVNFL
ncbi:MAG: hypothetical protein SGARI_007453, partial [Bacillariaceae sp.]